MGPRRVRGGARTWSDARCPSGGGVSRSYAPGAIAGADRRGSAEARSHLENPEGASPPPKHPSRRVLRRLLARASLTATASPSSPLSSPGGKGSANGSGQRAVRRVTVAVRRVLHPQKSGVKLPSSAVDAARCSCPQSPQQCGEGGSRSSGGSPVQGGVKANNALSLVGVAAWELATESAPRMGER